MVIAAATLITASVAAIAGGVGWVGPVIPHIARMLVGPSFAALLPVAAILGAGDQPLVDTLCRALASIESPPGILTAVLGAPVFLWLLARGRRGGVARAMAHVPHAHVPPVPGQVEGAVLTGRTARMRPLAALTTPTRPLP